MEVNEPSAKYLARAAKQRTEIGVLPLDWKLCRLGEITKLMTNGFVGTATKHYAPNEAGAIYIQGFNVEANAFNLSGVKYVTEAFHLAHQKSCLREGDLLTVQTGDVGLTSVVPPSLVGANCHALIISRLDRAVAEPRYVSQYMNCAQGRARLKLIETGTTMKHLNVGDMLGFVVPQPPIVEQREIAQSLTDADALIDSLEQLLAKKRQIKQGAMQELLTGKRRLPGYKSPWHPRRIGSFAPLQRGFDLPARARKSGEYPVVYSNGILNFHSEFMVKGPGVVTGRSGTIGAVTFVEQNYWPHNTALWVTDFNSSDPKFVFYLLQHIGLDRFATGSGVPTLNRNDVHAFVVHVPSSVGEQAEIAQVLSDIDTELATLESRLSKARALKQAMAQALLTGRIRIAAPTA